MNKNYLFLCVFLLYIPFNIVAQDRYMISDSSQTCLIKNTLLLKENIRKNLNDSLYLDFCKNNGRVIFSFYVDTVGKVNEITKFTYTNIDSLIASKILYDLKCNTNFYFCSNTEFPLTRQKDFEFNNYRQFILLIFPNKILQCLTP